MNVDISIGDGSRSRHGRIKAQRQAEDDGLGRRKWKGVQKDFKGTETWMGFAGAFQRPVSGMIHK